MPLVINMLNQNMTQRGTEATRLGVMISRCSSDSQYWRLVRHPANVGCSFFRYSKDDLRNHFYFRSNPSQRGYRKRMIEIWLECASFQTTCQRLADQARRKKGYLSNVFIITYLSKYRLDI